MSQRDDLHAQAETLAEQIVTDLCSDESALVLHATRVTEQIQTLVDEAYRQGESACADLRATLADTERQLTIERASVQMYRDDEARLEDERNAWRVQIEAAQAEIAKLTKGQT